jgi:hypothetical protein
MLASSLVVLLLCPQASAAVARLELAPSHAIVLHPGMDFRDQSQVGHLPDRLQTVLRVNDAWIEDPLAQGRLIAADLGGRVLIFPQTLGPNAPLIEVPAGSVVAQFRTMPKELGEDLAAKISAGDHEGAYVDMAQAFDAKALAAPLIAIGKGTPATPTAAAGQELSRVLHSAWTSGKTIWSEYALSKSNLAEHGEATLGEFFAARARKHEMTPAQYRDFVLAQMALPIGAENDGHALKYVDPRFLAEIKSLPELFRADRSGTGQKNYDLPGFFLAKTAFGRMIRELIEQSPSRRDELIFRIVGLGREVGELYTLVEAFEELKLQTAAQAANVQIRLYDLKPEVLRTAAQAASDLESAKPWLRGRIAVEFADMTDGDRFGAWAPGTSALVMARNSLRDRMVPDAPRFLDRSVRALVGGGMFVTDYLVSMWLSGAHYSIPSVGALEKPLTVGDGDYGMEIFRRRVALDAR